MIREQIVVRSPDREYLVSLLGKAAQQGLRVSPISDQDENGWMSIALTVDGWSGWGSDGKNDTGRLCYAAYQDLSLDDLKKIESAGILHSRQYIYWLCKMNHEWHVQNGESDDGRSFEHWLTDRWLKQEAICPNN